MTPQAISLNAYPSIREFLQRALAAPTGIKVTFETAGEARSKQMQCYTVRKRELETNRKRFSDDDPRQNSTVYDLLTFYRETPEGAYVTTKDTTIGTVLVISQTQGILDSQITEF